MRVASQWQETHTHTRNTRTHYRARALPRTGPFSLPLPVSKHVLPWCNPLQELRGVQRVRCADTHSHTLTRPLAPTFLSVDSLMSSLTCVMGAVAFLISHFSQPLATVTLPNPWRLPSSACSLSRRALPDIRVRRTTWSRAGGPGVIGLFRYLALAEQCACLPGRCGVCPGGARVCS